MVIVGLGPGDPGLVPGVVWQVLEQAGAVLVRTEQHPVMSELRRRGVSYEACDRFYHEGRDFAQVYEGIAGRVLAVLAAAEGGTVVYAVPGHPLVAEATVIMVLARCRRDGYPVQVIPAMSGVEAAYAALELDPTHGLLLRDALELTPAMVDPGTGLFLTQVYDRMVASEVKLTLMERYPDEHPVRVIRAAGVPGEERLVEVPLYQLDRLEWVDHLTSLYVPPLAGSSTGGAAYPLDPLVDVMAVLRGEQGCPWDQEQTHHTLKRYMLEEAYEVLDAIEKDDMHNLAEELGDLLLQIVFHAQIATENGHFDINRVVEAITAKMVRRHPHVFGEGTADTPDQVEHQWEKIKAGEKGVSPTAMKEVSRSFPALVRALKIQEAAARLGFDWPDITGVWDKVAEELRELRSAAGQDGRAVREELGDVLFAVVNLSRWLGVEPEQALMETVDKFTRRFALMEQQARATGRDLTAMSLTEMDILWEEAKKMT